MISVKCEYANYPSKNGKDFFVYTDFEVFGHADASNMHHTTGIKVCAGVSACCYGIRRLLDEGQFNCEIRKGYFHVWTDRRYDLRHVLDRDSVNALNTLLCQLYEIYCEYPIYFKTFDLIDAKEKIEDECKRTNDEQWCGEHTTRRKRRNLQKLGIRSLIEKAHY